ncbi:uncharacterized protein BDZ99DRAFT_466113 [Mytilinidion resinicola]|uniref:Uncharacterized protein n=1 Tax=Mytilinidion resinicola TaxID=574789 RepID=A0A6A6YCK1_9PEZI|nr:uncharacterized protein BDZ99DRAFT_466113 [Mytilinidion resinicola]KAF2806541.1 hypothetical protein BDZ99DRAFT_466113 [Mytilinidion resinicola]
MLSFQLILLAFSILSSTTASDPFQIEKRFSESQQPLDDITWIEPYRRFVVKLDTPGYPRWLLNKTTTVAQEHTRAADWYYAVYDQPSAILLNFTLSSDNKTLYLNSQAILPLMDTMLPPSLAAYQVPADISRNEFSLLKHNHVLSWAYYGMTIAYQRLTIDYDRLVWADPSSGPYQNHVPTLRFRLMGLGSYKQDDVLDDRLQKVVHVTLADQKHGSSDASDRSYLITEVAIKESRRSYAYAGVLPNDVSRIDDCSARSWRCEDHGLYAEGEPWYRYIWRHKFDQYGRIGSQRHQILRRCSRNGRGHIRGIWNDSIYAADQAPAYSVVG